VLHLNSYPILNSKYDPNPILNTKPYSKPLSLSQVGEAAVGETEGEREGERSGEDGGEEGEDGKAKRKRNRFYNTDRPGGG
jgi:hypothetical protein